MFEDLLKTISGLNGSKVEVQISAEPDEQGYIDRECPAEECIFTFKVHGEDWRDIVRDEAVWCPFCGEERDANAWWTTEQIESGQQAALAKVGGLINGAMLRDAASFNRRQPKRSFLSMTMRVDARPKTVTLPAAASAPMELKVTCETCQCRVAVIGSAYFCPACGHNGADRVFQQSLRTIAATLDNLDAIVAGLPDRDAAHNSRISAFPCPSCTVGGCGRSVQSVADAPTPEGRRSLSPKVRPGLPRCAPPAIWAR